MDFAERVHNHNYKMDPIVRSLLDTDFYKLLMMQFIWKLYRNVVVTFRLINRTKSIRIAANINEHELREQLDYVRKLRFTKSELIWLAGNTFYGKKGIFCPEFIEYLSTFALPAYELRKLESGQYDLTFTGPWVEVTLWEIYAMTVVGTMRNRAGMKDMSRFQLERLYVEAKNRLFTGLDTLATAGVQGISDFGTRRRHDFLWQEYCVLAAKEILGKGLVGTSNVLLAMKHDLEPIGTNAHETRMVLATLANTDEELRNAPYLFDRQWMEMYHGNLLVMLPDTFGTTGYLKNAPEFLNDCTGLRIDSKDPFIAGEEAIDWWESRDLDPMTKRIIPSDGLDVETIVKLWNHFNGRVGIGFGWGTMLTNNFPEPVKPISLVCKVFESNGKSAVKLSDNYTKATGNIMEVARYREIFGVEGIANAPVIV